MRVALAALLLLLAAGPRAASVDPALPHYQPRDVEIPASAGYVDANGAIVVVGYIARYGVLGARPIAIAIARASVHLEDAAATVGAGYLRRYRRACDYLAAAMIHLKDNILLTEPLRPEHLKPPS